MGDALATRADVARLLGRVAFGANAADLDAWAGRPYADLVAALVDIPAPGTTGRAVQADDAVRVAATVGNNLQLGQRWWLGRMQTTPYRLEERLVLFWHDHWATAVGDATPRLLLEQNETLRKHALGNFRAMCEAMTIDAAMLLWLDGNVNIAAKPNENYAREFFELFTLGTVPQVYTETDIRESARALTGWVVDGGLVARYVTGRHDKGTKTILGRTVANLEGEEYKAVVDIALAQPIAPKFVAYKLVQNLGYLPETVDLLTAPDPLVDEVAASLASDWDIREAVRTLLLSDRFRYAEAGLGRQVVRQPCELAVHGAKATGVASDDAALLLPLARAGQKLFQPPNVGGWPVGKRWLSGATVIARYDLGVVLTNRRRAQAAALRAALPPTADLDGGGLAWAAHMGLASLSTTTLDACRSYVAARVAAGGATEAELQDGVFVLLASSPDWEVM